MIVVIHYKRKEEPHIMFDMTEASEKRILTKLRKTCTVERCSSEEWPGQDNPKYAVHHYNAK